MSQQLVVELIREMFYTTGMLVAPILMVALGIGVLVSILQAVTSIQEQTLVFIPKIFGVMAVIFLILPWMIKVLMNFTLHFFQYILMISQ